MNFKGNEIFLYRERSFPLERNFNQKLFEDKIYPWKYACTSEDIRKNPFNEDMQLGRFIYKDIGDLVEKISSFYTSLDKKSNLIVLSNPIYRGEFITEDSHAHDWSHREEGVNENILNYFAGELRRRGFESSYKIPAIKIEDAFR